MRRAIKLIFRNKKVRSLAQQSIRRLLYFKWGELLFRKITKAKPESVMERVFLIKDLSRKYQAQVFIETGTYLGDLIWQLKDNFQKIYTIEIEPIFFKFARKRFSKEAHIEVLHGDSADILLELLPKVQERCLFFLDAHDSGFHSGQGIDKTPIIRELSAIQKHHRNDHIIVIDDARDFNGTNGYPTKEELVEKLKSINSNYKIEQIEDRFITIL